MSNGLKEFLVLGERTLSLREAKNVEQRTDWTCRMFITELGLCKGMGELYSRQIFIRKLDNKKLGDLTVSYKYDSLICRKDHIDVFDASHCIDVGS